jgi:hypothetical protein
MTTEAEDLIGRMRVTLAELALISEAPAAKALDERVQITTGGKSEGTPPARPLEPPLFDKHRDQLNGWVDLRRGDPLHDPDLLHLRWVVSSAENDLKHAKYRSPNRRAETTAERDARCLTDYEGVHYVDAAESEGCTRSWLRTLRTKSGREPSYGTVNSSA